MAFLVFEGIDGAGKSTLIENLNKLLRSQGDQVVVTREPGGSRLGDAIRKLLLDPNADAPTPRAELLLYQAIRAQHVDKLIRPALNNKQWVLCDRFFASSVAFQCFGRGLAREQVDWLNHYAAGGLEPDLTVLLDLDPRVGQQRLQKRNVETGHDRFEQEKLDFHQRVRDGYLRQAQQAQTSSHPWLVLDAELPPESLFAQLTSHLRGLKWLA